MAHRYFSKGTFVRKSVWQVGVVPRCLRLLRVHFVHAYCVYLLLNLKKINKISKKRSVVVYVIVFIFYFQK